MEGKVGTRGTSEPSGMARRIGRCDVSIGPRGAGRSCAWIPA